MSDNVPISLEGPRIIKPRAGRPDPFIAVRRLLFIPTILAIVFSLYAARDALTAFGGATARGAVLKVWQKDGHYKMLYRVISDGQINWWTSEIDQDSFNSLHLALMISEATKSAAPTIDVRLSPFSSHLTPMPMTSPDMPVRQFGLIWIAALGLDIVYMLVFWPHAARPQHQLDLLRTGRATAGRITGKAPSQTRAYSGSVTYCYKISLEGGTESESTGFMTVSGDDYNSRQVGDPVTVVYSLKNPADSAVYDFADFEEEDEDLSEILLEEVQHDAEAILAARAAAHHEQGEPKLP